MTMSYWKGKYAINKSYVDAIRENGGRVRLIPCLENETLLKEEIKELEGLFREIYKKDSTANKLNKQGSFKKLKYVEKIFIP